LDTKHGYQHCPTVGQPSRPYLGRNNHLLLFYPTTCLELEDLIALANAPEEDNIVFHVSLRSTMVAIVRLRCITSTIHHHPVQSFNFNCKFFNSIIFIHPVGVMAVCGGERVAVVEKGVL
jgi:hypothetical protein